jgi:hypothetical protein
MKDGEAVVPADYRSWPKMLSLVQRPDAKQVRGLYIDPKGNRNRAGDAFAYGTVMVMENDAATYRGAAWRRRPARILPRRIGLEQHRREAAERAAYRRPTA